MATKKRLASGIEHLLESAEKAVESFPPSPSPKEPEVTVNFKIPQSLHIALKVHVAQKGTNIKELITKLLQQELTKNEIM